MQKIFSVLALILMLAPVSVPAQSEGDDAAQSPMDRMAAKLGLSDEQQAEIEKIIQVQREKQIALRQETQKQINEVLTEEQRQKLQEIQQQRQEEMRKRMEQMQKQRGESGGQ